MRIELPTVEPEPEPSDTEGLEKFAEQRGIPVEFLGKMGLHIAPSDNEMPGWIAIPFPNLTGIWHKRYRNPSTKKGRKYHQAAGTDVHLYNPLKLGPNADLVIFTEGELDCLVLAHLGYPAIGIPGTSSSTERFRKHWKLLYQSARVIIAFDNDTAGQESAHKFADLLDTAGIDNRLVTPPREGWDINDWFLADRDGLTRVFDSTIGGW